MLIEHDTFRLACEIAKRENRGEALDLIVEIVRQHEGYSFLQDVLARIIESTLSKERAEPLMEAIEKAIDEEAGRSKTTP